MIKQNKPREYPFQGIDMEGRTKLIYILGKPGVGKYTIAKHLQDYVICDNHQITNAILALLQVERERSPCISDYVDRMRHVVLDFIAAETYTNYVLTNNLYNQPFGRQIYQDVYCTALKRESIFVPVRLNIAREEHMRRIQQEERGLRLKTTHTDHMNRDLEILQIDHPNLLDIDVTHLQPDQVASLIMDFADRKAVEG